MKAVNKWTGRKIVVSRHGTAAFLELYPDTGDAWDVWEMSGGGSKTVRISCDNGVITLEELEDA